MVEEEDGRLIGGLQLMSWMCAMFRFYTRIFVTYALGWDDFFLVLVMVRAKRMIPDSRIIFC